MSDWEDEQTEESNLAAINEKSWKQIAEQRYNDGMREAAGVECEESLQRGFSDAFKRSISSLLPLSRLRGDLCATQTLDNSMANSERTQELLNQLSKLEQDVQEEIARNGNMNSSLTDSNILSSVTDTRIKESIKTVENYICDAIENTTACKPPDKDSLPSA